MEDRQKWLEWRRMGLGSSDAPIVRGVSKWKKPHALFLEKISTEPIKEETSFVMERGNQLEPIARQKFAAKWNILHDCDEDFAAQTVTMEDLPFMRASLDGISKSGDIIIEIKFQGAQPHADTKEGRVPVHYYPQLQHGLLVSGAKVCMFISINADHEIAVAEVFRNEEYMSEHIRACADFWEKVQQKDWNYAKPVDFTTQFERYYELDEEIKHLTAQRDTIKEALALSSQGKDLDLGQYKLKWTTRIGNVDYSKIPEIKGLNLDMYRKESSTFPTLTKVKEK